MLRAIFDFSLDGVLLSAPDGRIFAANPAACELLRMTEEEICRAGRGPLMDPTDERWGPALEERRRSGRVRAEVRMRRGDGTVFPADVSARVFEGAGGELRACTIFRDATERRAMIEKLASLVEELGRQATVDPLTEIPNRRGFMLAVAEELALADREGAQTVFLYVDVDNMKRINDSLGHRAGDAALISVARALRGATRTSDAVGRIGGDEFAVLLYAAREDEVAVACRRIRRELRLAAEVPVSVSTGTLVREAGDGRAIEVLLADADRRMYQYKRGHRGEDRASERGDVPFRAGGG